MRAVTVGTQVNQCRLCAQGRSLERTLISKACMEVMRDDGRPDIASKASVHCPALRPKSIEHSPWRRCMQLLRNDGRPQHRVQGGHRLGADMCQGTLDCCSPSSAMNRMLACTPWACHCNRLAAPLKAIFCVLRSASMPPSLMCVHSCTAERHRQAPIHLRLAAPLQAGRPPRCANLLV